MNGELADDAFVLHWARRIAAQVIPEEAAVAGDVTAHFLTGGTARRALLRPPPTGSGAAGGDVVLGTAQLLEALVSAGGYLQALLGSATTGNVPGILAAVAAYRAYHLERARRRAEPVTPLPRPLGVDALAATRAQASLDALRSSMQQTGASPATATVRACATVTILLSSPEEMTRCIAAFSAVTSGEAPGHPGPEPVATGVAGSRPARAGRGRLGRWLWPGRR